ncbi:MAG: condensation domain-containing protein [Christensenellaceae bacterium]|jgi:NRPS condensation-like uncharacterized protein|nr:condensation domain-containing protein [Christensenellaceae bacterium]
MAKIYKKAEMWDKMQDIMEKWNDHMTHGYFELDRNINSDNLKMACEYVADCVPILKAKWYSGVFHARWIETDTKANELPIFEFRETKNKLSAEGNLLLTRIVNKKNGPQFRVTLLRNGSKDAVLFVTNHQIMDGADLKLFYKSIADVYSALEKGLPAETVQIKNGERGIEQLYKNFTDAEKAKLKKMISYSKAQKKKIEVRFAKSKFTDRLPKLNKAILPAETFLKLKSNCKILGVTLNDIILAQYLRTVYEFGDLPDDARLGVPNMINMRKYLNGEESGGFSNLTSMVVPALAKLGAELPETAVRCRFAMDRLKKDYPGFHGWSLLQDVYHYAPHSLAKFLIGTFFKNPLVGISNIGIIGDKEVEFGNAEIIDAYMTGSIKHPPYIQLALTTFKNKITFTMAEFGTMQDYILIDWILDSIVDGLTAFANAHITEELAKAAYENAIR